jgi:L-rhamnose mutarotase
MDDLPSEPVMRRWWHFMGDIMRTNDSGEPIVTPLPEMFHLD